MRGVAGRRPSERARTSPSFTVSIAPAGSTEVRRYGIIGGTLDAVDKLLKKLSAGGVELRVVYEAGPCGFVLCRHLRNQGWVCDVVAPSLIPKKATDRVKTDRRDADQLARLYRAGELTAIHVPDQEDEAVRDLVRARTAAMVDQRQARNCLKGFLLRLGFRYAGKSSWNDAHKRYLAGLVMPQPPQQIAFQEYIHAINDATERLARLTQAMGSGAEWGTSNVETLNLKTAVQPRMDTDGHGYQRLAEPEGCTWRVKAISASESVFIGVHPWFTFSPPQPNCGI